MKAMQADMKADAMPIKASVLFEMFPFSILYNVRPSNQTLFTN